MFLKIIGLQHNYFSRNYKPQLFRVILQQQIMAKSTYQKTQ
jgi:hypothetical protein